MSDTAIHFGTVGYQYRDWQGPFYPKGSSHSRQLKTYFKNFDLCELAQFAYQIPSEESVFQYLDLAKSGKRFFIRLHQSITHCFEIKTTSTMLRHYKKCFQPLIEASPLSGFVACFPYAFRYSQQSQDYVLQMKQVLAADTPLYLDFKHGSWRESKARAWCDKNGIYSVHSDEPGLLLQEDRLLEGFSAPLFLRFHGRNQANWWSGNQTMKYDYLYSVDEIASFQSLLTRITTHSEAPKNVFCVFQNHWQAKAAINALQLKQLLFTSSELATEPTLFISSPELEHPPRQIDFDLRPALD